MDPISQVVGLLRPKALLWKQVEGRGEWAWRFPAETGILFGLVLAGSCSFEMPELEAGKLTAGDFLIMIDPPSWILKNGQADREIPFNDVKFVVANSTNKLDSGSEITTRICAGHFQFETTNADLLTGFLSPVVQMRSTDHGARRLGRILSMIDDEFSAGRLGQTLMLERLLELVLIETLRTPAALSGERTKGLLVALANPQIGSALKAFHANIRGEWTVKTLAAHAGMSRSIFFDKFKRLLGETPINYVLNWRIAFAKDALRFSESSTDEIAFAIGYGSASAFSTAFTRTVGQSPAKFARAGKS